MRACATGAAVAMVWVLAVCSAAPAQENDGSAWKEAGPELRVYDVKAYFTRTPIYNFARVPGTDESAMAMAEQALFEGAGGRAGIFADADPDYERDAASKAARLMGFVQRFVRPKEPWETEGGRSKIDIMVDRGLMVVYTTPDGHTMIETLLNRVVPAEKRNMVIDIRVVELNAAALGVEEPAGFIARTDAQKATLKQATTKVHARTSVSGTDGQVLSNEKGAATTYVADQEPVVAEAAVGFAARIERLTAGFAVQVQALLDTPGEKAMLDFRMILQQVLGMRTVKVQNAAGETAIEGLIELPTVIADSQAGTLTLPVGCPVVLAGGGVPKSLFTGEENDTETVDIYYVATVRLMPVE